MPTPGHAGMPDSAVARSTWTTSGTGMPDTSTPPRPPSTLRSPGTSGTGMRDDLDHRILDTSTASTAPSTARSGHQRSLDFPRDRTWKSSLRPTRPGSPPPRPPHLDRPTTTRQDGAQGWAPAGAAVLLGGRTTTTSQDGVGQTLRSRGHGAAPDPFASPQLAEPMERKRITRRSDTMPSLARCLAASSRQPRRGHRRLPVGDAAVARRQEGRYEGSQAVRGEESAPCARGGGGSGRRRRRGPRSVDRAPLRAAHRPPPWSRAIALWKRAATAGTGTPALEVPHHGRHGLARVEHKTVARSPSRAADTSALSARSLTASSSMAAWPS